MGRNRARWSDETAGIRPPLRRERQQQPRFDVDYADGEGGHRVRFAADGSVVLGGDNGRWFVEDGDLQVATARCSCEGAIGLSEVFLSCVELGSTKRMDLVLREVGGGSPVQTGR